ncbi:hypothetical protein NLJ89_g2737 [Agrocybe chaxingu]|uniref:beta-glucosidase n=1 Tax=Agrocybe chaxingu TaxID=84603 RepID=A0A9W8MXW5_9AGAR|nr:hypothetical protein NLJ89_g2737 [Agrocybe chaxingu]
MRTKAEFWIWVSLVPFVFAQSSSPTSSTADPATTTSDVSTVASSSAATQSATVPADPGSTFVPFPVPSDAPLPIYPATDPLRPPEVGSRSVPNFGPAWTAAWQKAKEKIADFTLEEKVSVATGTLWQRGRCVGNIAPVEPVDGRGWKGLCLQDGPLGVRPGDYITGFPTGINAAATFNRRLIRLRGLAMGREFVGKGVNIALSPMMNMGRVAGAGRNWEGFGGDPFLTGEAAYETILGLQGGGIIACAKHLVANEQEHKRTTSTSDVDDRTMHEIYAHPFLRSVMAGVGSMMCSYNQVNGTYACDNDKVMNDIVKREYGFQGFIMTDWFADHNTVSVSHGLDMSMPGDMRGSTPGVPFGANLVAAVQNGEVPEGRVDDMATRIIASWYLLHQDDASYPPVSFSSYAPDDDATNLRVDVQDDHYKLVREIGAASAVLLKNVNDALPLGKKNRNIAVIGTGAGGGRAGPNQFNNKAGSDGVITMGWGSGAANLTYVSTPLDAVQREARKFRTSVDYYLDDWNLAGASVIARKRSAALVFVTADSGEGTNGDRLNLTTWFNGEALIAAVAANNNNTIVVVNSVGPLIVEDWIDHPNVTAVLWAGVPGQEVGNSIADVLYGAYNPSGRLPYTIAKKPEDYGAQLALGGGDTDILSIPYDDRLEIDYRHFDANNIAPRFEFGFGLSYTKFSYGSLRLNKINNAVSAGERPLVDAWEKGEATPVAVGSSRAAWLHVPAYRATFSVRNTGSVAGSEIPQLYLHFPTSAGEPPSVLRGFTNVELRPGEQKTATITLSRYDLSVWDTERQGWRKPEGEFGVTVGASSRDGRLKGTVPL